MGGILVERTVKDVVPALQTNRDGVRMVPYFQMIVSLNEISNQIRKVISSLTEQYKTKEEEFEGFKRDYNIRPATI